MGRTPYSSHPFSLKELIVFLIVLTLIVLGIRAAILYEPPTVVHETEEALGRHNVSERCTYAGYCHIFDWEDGRHKFRFSSSCPGHYNALADLFKTRRVYSNDDVRETTERRNITPLTECS